MGKPILVASVASAAALYGSYNVAKAFIPGSGYVNANARSAAALRGSQSADVMDSTSMSTAGLNPMALATGALTLATLGSSGKTRMSRPATATAKEVATTANEVIEPAPPPPFNPAEQVGVTAPLGFFDPLGFAKVGDEEGFRKLRSAELKHGRVAMMASVGALFQSCFQFPGFDKIPKGVAAVTTFEGAAGVTAIVVVSGVLELFVWKDDPSKLPGDFGNPFQLGLGKGPWGGDDGMKNRELNNGRAAMFATLGIIVAELATGKDAHQQLGF